MIIFKEDNTQFSHAVNYQKITLLYALKTKELAYKSAN